MKMKHGLLYLLPLKNHFEFHGNAHETCKAQQKHCLFGAVSQINEQIYFEGQFFCSLIPGT